MIGGSRRRAARAAPRAPRRPARRSPEASPVEVTRATVIDADAAGRRDGRGRLARRRPASARTTVVARRAGRAQPGAIARAPDRGRRPAARRRRRRARARDARRLRRRRAGRRRALGGGARAAAAARAAGGARARARRSASPRCSPGATSRWRASCSRCARARDLDHGRQREAALQLDAALEAGRRRAGELARRSAGWPSGSTSWRGSRRASPAAAPPRSRAGWSPRGRRAVEARSGRLEAALRARAAREASSGA